jgi:hypothetical protein
VTTQKGGDNVANGNLTAKRNKIFDIAGFLFYRWNQSFKKDVRLIHTPADPNVA